MKNIFLTLPLSCLFFGFASCDSGSSSSSFTSVGDPAVDSVLQVYLNEFLVEADKRGIDLNGGRLGSLTIRFGDLEPGTLGLCSASSQENVVTVSNEATEDQYRWIVVHELGHCVLRIDHRDDVLSVMNSALSFRRLNNLGEEAVYDEFFQEQFFEGF